MTPKEIPAKQRKTPMPSNAPFLGEGGSTDISDRSRAPSLMRGTQDGRPGEAEGEEEEGGEEEGKESREELRGAGAEDSPGLTFARRQESPPRFQNRRAAQTGPWTWAEVGEVLCGSPTY